MAAPWDSRQTAESQRKTARPRTVSSLALESSQSTDPEKKNFL